MSATSEDLELANRHIREAEFLIRRQRKIVQNFIRGGHDSSQAEELLTAMLATLKQFQIHRDLIRNDLN